MKEQKTSETGKFVTRLSAAKRERVEKLPSISSCGFFSLVLPHVRISRHPGFW